MERQLRELWTPFAGGDKSIFDMVPEFFAGTKTHFNFFLKHN
jgi:hypothetical protein